MKMNATYLKPNSSQRPSGYEAATGSSKTSSGFTLVEMLVVIAIIGILVGLTLPAIRGAIETARDAERKLEVERLSRGFEKYEQKYGDYPPDGSDINVIQRHFRKLFPRLHSDDNALLTALTSSTASGAFSPAAMDRAEAVVFFLGGFSDDITRPISGPGGPLEFKDFQGDGNTADIANYQYNLNRNNPFFEFDAGRLDTVLNGSRYISNDEIRYEYTGQALAARGGRDLLPTFLADDGETPVVYFDSRTYGLLPGGVYNGYSVGGEFGAVRPYKTQVGAEGPDATTYETTANAMAAVSFQRVDTFQIIHPGSDGVFGASIFDSQDPQNPEIPPSGALPVYFIAETGVAISPDANANSFDALKSLENGVSYSRFNDSAAANAVSSNGHLDNITNSSTSTLESDLP